MFLPVSRRQPAPCRDDPTDLRVQHYTNSPFPETDRDSWPWTVRLHRQTRLSGSWKLHKLNHDSRKQAFYSQAACSHRRDLSPTLKRSRRGARERVFFLARGSTDESALCSCLGPVSHDLAEPTGPCYSLLSEL